MEEEKKRKTRNITAFKSKFDNETRKFIQDLAGDGSLKELAKRLNITYICLHTQMKRNRISNQMFVSILNNMKLSGEQMLKLRELNK